MNKVVVVSEPSLITMNGFFENLVSLFVKKYLSENTRAAYASDLQQFSLFYSSAGVVFKHPRDIQSHHLTEYRDDLLQNQKLETNSVLRKLVAVRQLIQWCCYEGIVDRNPLLNVQLPKAKQISTTQDFTDEEVKKILSIPRTNKPSGSLHYLVLVFLFHLGLRKSELVEVKIKDLYEERNHYVLSVCGKGSKFRKIPVSPFIRNAIDNFKTVSGKRFLPDDFLFQPVRNNFSKVTDKQIHVSTVDWIVKHYAALAGVKKKVSPHSCRATVVGHLLDHKVPIRDIAIMVGHSQVQTTSIYDKRKQDLDKSAALRVHY